tara:strand:- start:1601 stop:3415 length:1815 start_codon:yes stop_codon:yes gene_type:complete
MLFPIQNVAQIGIIRDTPPYELPPNAWSDGNNIRFLDNGVRKVSGYSEVFSGLVSANAPYKILPAKYGVNYYWLAFGLNKINVWNGSTWTDITRQTTNTLDGGISDSDTTITLTDASAFPSSGYIQIDAEQISYSGKSTNDLTGCSRGYNSTSPILHLTGAVVTPILTTSTTDNDYSATADENWRVTVDANLIVATNGYDTPQMWPLSSGSPDVTHPMKELENWPATTTYCKSIVAFRSFLVGFNWTIGGTEYPSLVKWSNEAAAYTAPSSWDETDADLSCGEYELTESAGKIIDALPLGDSLIVYKDDSITIQNWIGSPFIFSFKTLSPNIGLLGKNCVAAFERGHFFIGNSDCYWNNGQSVKPLLPNKMRRAMFGSINGDNYGKCFVTADYNRNEALFCYPEDEATYCNKALIWNWVDDTFSLRDLPALSDIQMGVSQITSGETWDDHSEAWDDSPDPWGAERYGNVLNNLVFCSPSNIKIYRDNFGQKEDTATMTSYIERTGLTLGDQSSVKRVKAVWPKIDVTGDNTIKVWVASQMSPDGDVNWQGPTLFNPNTQSKVSCRNTGKYFGVKFETDSDVDWKLYGFEFELESGGRRGSRDYG